MQLLAFILLYPLIWCISILPFRLLYWVADIVYFLVYHIVGYRKKIVRQNLGMAFPEKSAAELKKIEKESYRHLCDMFLEMIKTMTISRKEIERRYTFTNMDLYLDLEKQGKSIALLCAHYASYEWAVSMNFHITFEGYAIYKKIANKYFDKVVRDIRTKYRAHLITTKETVPTLVTNQKNGILGVYGFVSDQSPKQGKEQHWVEFLGIDTPVHTGAEMLAKKYDMNVIFMRTEKVARGRYKGTFELLAENPRQVPDYQITDTFMKLVEKQIKDDPSYYLWTHKRWKYSRS
ncbi:lysophospholipid acyltransferase family protein [Flavobacterium silvaticum]|uniref:Lysophospholipid acyltransferase family protein n=1 Tax=Flavobacterium silvaticum TaxID=1852020 RepID=A0A972JK66_9FLAO|nr:lysophospholipid acyltransferase family protein [Flavobacterium silvaticum]NMH28827.1 lysophospholipid acyltransferase family protein [Flavobacterium silvaticum]